MIESLRAEGLEASTDASFNPHGWAWPRAEALRPAGDERFEASSWGYLGANPRTRWPVAARLLFVHPQRLKDQPPAFEGASVWTPYPEAALDLVLRKLWSAEWTGATYPVPADVIAEAGVVIGPDCVIGEGTILECGVRIGARVRIGRHCRIGAHSRIGDECVLGDHVHLSGHGSIGAQGFGLVDFPGFAMKRPRLHVGITRIGDNVRLGAYVSVDRAVFGETRIGDNTSIDNHVQIGHNSSVGAGSVLLGFLAIAGSTRIGNRVTISGLTATAGHLSIGNDVVIAGQSGVTADVPHGARMKGYPLRPMPEALKIASLHTRLPEIFERLKAVEKKLEAAKEGL